MSVSSAELGHRPGAEANFGFAQSVFPYFTGNRPQASNLEARLRIDGLINRALGTAAIELDFSQSKNAEQMYESLLANGLAQIAYPARDIMEFGYIRPETSQRVMNELIGTALDKLGKPFTSEFLYALDSNNELVAENGESVVAINERGLKRAQTESRQHPELAFRTRRFEADVVFIKRLQDIVTDDSLPVGTTLAAASACPNPAELGLSSLALKKLEYQPDVDMAVLWFGTKTESGIKLTTVNLFHATPKLLAQTISRVTGKRVPITEREATPWQQVQFHDKSGDAADRTPRTFDEIQNRGEPTIHGLTYAEAGSHLTAEKLIDTEDFQRTLAAAEDRLTEAAFSIVEARMRVPEEYLQAILTLKKPNGEFELEFEKRAAVRNILSSAYTNEDFVMTLRAVHTAVSAGLWAKISHLYHNDGMYSRSADFDSLDNSIQVLGYILDQRLAGHTPIGCSGGGTLLGGISIFDLKPDQLATVIFGGEDKKGSLVYTCENGHPNVRSANDTDDECIVCGCSLDCG